MGRMIDQLLKLAQCVMASAMAMYVDIGEIVEAALSRFKARIRQKQVIVEIDAGHTPGDGTWPLDRGSVC